MTGAFAPSNQIVSGQSPAKGTTVVNPLFATSPTPGSCVIAGSLLLSGLVVDDALLNGGNDVIITLSYSINQSFEWVDVNGNCQWDLDATVPANNEPVVNMGLRGLEATYTLQPSTSTSFASSIRFDSYLAAFVASLCSSDALTRALRADDRAAN
jgi:hypothetical protein